MTELNASSAGDVRKVERDAPAIADMPSIRRLLWALSNLRRSFTEGRRTVRKARSLHLYRMNRHMLHDIGLTDDEDPAFPRPSMLPLQRRDD